MNPKIFFTVFITVFLAELGDKTQLATMLFATDRENSKLTIFLAASLALIAATAIGVLAGLLLSQFISEKTLHITAGIGFLLIGGFLLLKALG
ncbi:MAG: TMEM165/GDT1 family protein [Deltaproteobacteria bacterium]|nr:TMEM165/GDT1 family protein [Candidatus Tharpella aukensis]